LINEKYFSLGLKHLAPGIGVAEKEGRVAIRPFSKELRGNF
jgi:hypothetical protein